MRVSVVIPCLNEAETIGECVRQARSALDENGLLGEVIVVDNGSTDGSGDLARSAGATVVEEPRRIGRSPGRRLPDATAGACHHSCPVHGTQSCQGLRVFEPVRPHDGNAANKWLVVARSEVVSVRRRRVSRVATISMHTSPLDQPGTGDAGGMNVYIVEVAKRLAELGVEIEIFTRQTARDLPPVAEIAPGVWVRHVTAGPYEELDKGDLPGQLCGFLSGVLRTEAMYEPGRYDVIHSHYWLSGQVGWLAKERWGVPLVHTMHTMAKVKNLLLAEDDKPEPPPACWASSRSWRSPTGWWPTPRPRPRSSSICTAPTPPRRGRQPRGEPQGLPARVQGRGPVTGSICRRTPTCCCSSAACSR